MNTLCSFPNIGRLNQIRLQTNPYSKDENSMTSENINKSETYLDPNIGARKSCTHTANIGKTIKV